MAIKINFDSQHVPQSPTLILSTRSGNKLGVLPAYNIVFKDNFNSYSEFSFKISKINNGTELTLWNDVKDFKLIFCKEWNTWFEINVEIDETNELIKNVSAKSLGESELSQVKLYNIEINTENDISRDDYEVTVLYNPTKPKSSLLNRIMEKAPHYRINHVDNSIANIQRTFSFNDKSLYDSLQEISEEINCIFEINTSSENNGIIDRFINVYDLESNCLNCGERGEFSGVCTKCNSTNISFGYGNDTNIFISTENLADNITFSTDVDSVKNCFKLEAGDDLMTATLISCNPNGSCYLWNISDEQKSDMSPELVEKLAQYDTKYNYYQNSYEIPINDNLLNKYNLLIKKYKVLYNNLEEIKKPVVGYPSLMYIFYNIIDFSIFLKSRLMPSYDVETTTASKQASLLTQKALSPVSVSDIERCSELTINNAIESMACTIVDPRYQVKINEGTLKNTIWTGNFSITNYSNSEDTAISNVINISINDDYENFVKQRIEKTLSKQSNEEYGILALFALDIDNFKIEITKYCLNSLKSFYDSCQACLDVLIEQGVANRSLWESNDVNLYDNLYVPYCQKQSALQDEINLRKSEIAIIEGVYDSDGNLINEGIKNNIEVLKNEIQVALNFEDYLGDVLWKEFLCYRREDTYSNDNYISDGLDNSKLFENALKFIESAKKDIYKSSNLQHSISATLKNLLVMKEFSSIVDYFEVGNWLRIKSNNSIYRLRLISYEIDFDNLNNIYVSFSDVTKVYNGFSDVESILAQASSMASSYNYIAHQADKGEKSNNQLTNWVANGLELTNMKIIDNASNQNILWDSHGILLRQYDDFVNDYAPTQMKIINSTLLITDDNWETVKTAVGGYYYFHPETGELKYAYGVNAETLIGKLILGEELGIYSSNNNLTFNSDGLNVTNGINSFTINPNSDILLAISQNNSKLLYVDKNGSLHINGDGAGLDISANSSIKGINDAINDVNSSIEQLPDSIILTVSQTYETIQNVSDAITNAKGEILGNVDETLKNDYYTKSEIDVTSEKIKSEVSEKVGNDEIGTKIEQNSDSVQIAWNQCSDYIKFEDGELKIYKESSENDDSSLIAAFNKTGTHFYDSGMDIGAIGTGILATNKIFDKYKGLVFHLKDQGYFMAWGVQDTSSKSGEDVFTARMIYCHNDIIDEDGNTIYPYGLHLDNCPLYLNTNGYDEEYSIYTKIVNNALCFYSEKYGVGLKSGDESIILQDGNIMLRSNNAIKFYADIDMNNHEIKNSSDRILKKNIHNSSFNAINILNEIHIRQFDWKDNNEHENAGIIAQELYNVLPDLVDSDEQTGLLSIKPIKFIPYLIKAIQELSHDIKELYNERDKSE